MADSVREKQRDGAARKQRLRFAAQYPEVDETVGDHVGGAAMHVAPLDARSTRLDCRLQGAVNNPVQLFLLGAEASRYGVSARTSLA